MCRAGGGILEIARSDAKAAFQAAFDFDLIPAEIFSAEFSV